MTNWLESMQQTYEFYTVDPVTWKDEKRLTKFGKFLRSTSLDELPELVNIINHLCNKDYIYITDPQNNTSFKKIKNLSCDVILKITLKGIKFLSCQK